MEGAQTIEMVLGAGGGRGFGHLGFLRYLDERQVRLGTITTVSIGALIGAFYVNGYSVDEIETALERHLSERACGTGLELLLPPLNAVRRKAGGFIDLVPLMRDMVEEYQLEPQPNLRIVAYNVLAGEPVVFDGTGYDLAMALAMALAASCSVPGATRPVYYRGMLLQDGGLYSTTPSALCSPPAIVSSLDRVREFPRYRLSLIALIAHLIELHNSWSIRHVPPVTAPPHIYVIVGCADVGTGTFRVPEKVYNRMVAKGYREAERTLAPLIADGTIAVGR